MSDHEFTEDERLALWLAKAALVAEQSGATDTALKALRRIDDECGDGGMDLAMCAWIDTFAGRTDTPLGAPVRLEFLRVGSHRRTGADEITRPEVVWAGRLAAARIARDADNYSALIDALPEDPDAIGRHVFAVLQMCTLGMTHFGVTP